MVVPNPTSLHLQERNSAVAEKEDKIAFSSSDSSQSNAPNPFQFACPETEGPALLVTFCSPSLDHLSPELLIFLPFEPGVCRNSTGRSWGSCLDPFSPNSDGTNAAILILETGDCDCDQSEALLLPICQRMRTMIPDFYSVTKTSEYRYVEYSQSCGRDSDSGVHTTDLNLWRELEH